MDDTNDHDHSLISHSAKCDEEACDFVAEVHAHDNGSAAKGLSRILAEHNKTMHGKETKEEDILGGVTAKMVNQNID